MHLCPQGAQSNRYQHRACCARKGCAMNKVFCSRADELQAEVERLRTELNARKDDPVTRLHKLCAGLERNNTEPLPCGHSLADYCDHCETCGVCRDEGKGEYATGKVEQLQAEVKRLNCELAATHHQLECPGTLVGGNFCGVCNTCLRAENEQMRMQAAWNVAYSNLQYRQTLYAARYIAEHAAVGLPGKRAKGDRWKIYAAKLMRDMERIQENIDDAMPHDSVMVPATHSKACGNCTHLTDTKDDNGRRLCWLSGQWYRPDDGRLCSVYTPLREAAGGGE
jgi:outer membrane murein-binding lipoprotein Lpp